MKFLITVHDFRSVNGYTLAPRQAALGLKEKGHQVCFFCINRPVSFFEGEQAEDFIEAGVGSVFRKNVISEFAPDVIITNGHSLVDMLALEYARKHKVFTVSYIHSRYEKAIEHRFLPWGEHWPQEFLHNIAEVFLKQYQQADIIIALGEEMREYLCGYFPASKLRVVGNGIDLERFPFQKRRISKDRAINLLYVANLEKRKNQIYLLKVMAELSANYVLHLVGGKEEDDYYHKFKRALRRHYQKHGNVIYHGKVSPERIGKLYSLAHIFVDASLMEAQSVVLLEAMASGLPIVRLYNKHTRGVTSHLLTALHVPDTAQPSEFAGAVQKLAKDASLYAKISGNEKKVRTEFSREHNVARLLKIIEEALPERI